MGLFARLRSVRRSRPLRAASRQAVEMLESRTMLNATLSSAVAPLTLTPGGTASTVDLNAHFNDPNVTETAVEIQTPQGNIPVALTDAQTPLTVANFLHYINAGEYNGVIFHRSVPGFVIQGGGYTTDGNHINQFAAVQNEPGISNTRGTIAMAKLGNDPNSATSEWFINLADNSSNLNNQNGGFTVFGNVLYNGMQVADQIAALPTVSDSQNPPGQDSSGGNIWSNLPVQNWTGSSTPTSVPAANMITTNAVVVPALTYTVSSDNTALVNPSVSGGALTLTPGGGTGIANITVTATDLGGNVATTTFQVGVGVTPATALNTPLGTGGAKQVRFTDANGTSTVVSLSGPGSATLNVDGTVASQVLGKNKVLTVAGTGLQIASIVATGTTGATTLNITGHGGNGTVEMGSLSTDGALRALNGRNTALSGAATINGAVGSVNLLRAASGTLATSSIGHMTVKGAFSDDLSAASIGSFTAGSMTGGTWTVSGNAARITAGTISNWTANLGSLGKLTSRGAITGSTINSAGNVGTVAAASLTGSTVFAGVGSLPTGQALPASSADFAAAASLAALRVRSFANSDVAAQTLGRLTLGQVTTDNGGTAFGVAGHTIQALTAASAGKTLRLKNAAAQTDVTAAITKSGFVQGDFLVEIL